MLAQRGLTRVPVLAGECEWTGSVDGGRVKAGLTRKAVALTPETGGLRYAVCAREAVDGADEQTLTVTSHDIFGPLRTKFI